MHLLPDRFCIEYTQIACLKYIYICKRFTDLQSSKYQYLYKHIDVETSNIAAIEQALGFDWK